MLLYAKNTGLEKKHIHDLTLFQTGKLGTWDLFRKGHMSASSHCLMLRSFDHPASFISQQSVNHRPSALVLCCSFFTSSSAFVHDRYIPLLTPLFSKRYIIHLWHFRIFLHSYWYDQYAVFYSFSLFLCSRTLDARCIRYPFDRLVFCRDRFSELRRNIIRYTPALATVRP